MGKEEGSRNASHTDCDWVVNAAAVASSIPQQPQRGPSRKRVEEEVAKKKRETSLFRLDFFLPTSFTSKDGNEQKEGTTRK